MKKLFLFLNLLIISQLACSQGVVSTTFQPSIEETFRKAKSLNRPVFIECYHPDCPICQALEPTLRSAEVGEFYNQNFVNFRLNLEDTKQVKFLDSKKIRLPGFPMFLYFDKDENLIHQNDPQNTKESIIENGKTALNPAIRASSYHDRYHKGERDLSFLINYAYLTRVTQDTALNRELANAVFEAYPKKNLASPESWAITSKVVLDAENGFAKFWFDNVATARGFVDQVHHPDAEKNALGTIIQSSLFSKRGMNYNLAQVNMIKEDMVKIGVGQYVTGMTWQHEARALLRENRAKDALSLVDNLAKQNSKNGQTLVFLVSFCNENFKDGNYVNLAKNWLSQAQPLLKEQKDIAEMHYEAAKMYQKVGENSTAKKSAVEAQKAAILAKIDAKKFTKLLDELK